MVGVVICFEIFCLCGIVSFVTNNIRTMTAAIVSCDIFVILNWGDKKIVRFRIFLRLYAIFLFFVMITERRFGTIEFPIQQY